MTQNNKKERKTNGKLRNWKKGSNHEKEWKEKQKRN